MKTFDSSYFIVKNYFKEDGAQNYLLFQPISRYLKKVENISYCGNLKDYLTKLLHF